MREVDECYKPSAESETQPNTGPVGNTGASYTEHLHLVGNEGISRETARLLTCSRAPMADLHLQLANPRISVLLANRSGQILSMIGMPSASSLSHRQNAGLMNGAKASKENDATAEAAIAMPTRNDAGRQQVDGHFVFGIAAPINAASGGILGILDRSNLPGTGLRHVNALLQLTAETIERRIVESDERGFLLVRFHTRVMN